MNANPEPAEDPAATGPSEGSAEESPSFDLLQIQAIIEARNRRRRLTELPSLVARAVVLVWQTNWSTTVGTVVLQVSGAAITTVQVLLGGFAVSALLHGGTGHVTGTLLLSAVALAIVSAVGGLTSAGSSQLGRLLGIQVQRRVTDDVLDVSTAVDLVAYDDPSYYDQLNRMLTTLPIQPSSIVTALAGLIGGVVGAGSLVVTLLVLSPQLVVLLLISGLPLWFVNRRAGAIEFGFAVDQTSGAREREYLVELLTRRESAAEVRAYRTFAALRERYVTSYDRYIAAYRTLIRRRYALQGVSGAIVALATIATLLLLIRQIDNHEVSVGRAASAAVAVRLLASRIEMTLDGVGALFQSALFLQDFAEFTRRSLSRTERPAVTEQTASLTGTVRLDDVTFYYPNARTPAVENVSVTLRSGQVVALVGENGSGKTTLAKLLAGLYEPGSGTIIWSTASGGGVPAVQAGDGIALVLQDFLRYQLSALDNITFGRSDRAVDEQAARSAAVSAGIEQLLTGLPEGFATRLSRQFSGGRELSAGQWQRVALARAYYRDAAVVVLDEPAAALDPRAEARLYDSVRNLFGGRTVLMITHRMRSVQQADRILVMRGGRLLEDGTHDALRRAGGLYDELVRLQDGGGLGRAMTDVDLS